MGLPASTLILCCFLGLRAAIAWFSSFSQNKCHAEDWQVCCLREDLVEVGSGQPALPPTALFSLSSRDLGELSVLGAWVY